jgi:DNA polymerase III epsilon subunit-like protein
VTEKSVVIFDTEYWSNEGVPSRNWGGMDDYPPLTVQIGAYRVLLDSTLTIQDEFLCYIIPRDACGARVPLNPFFTELTGIDCKTLDDKGLELKKALENFSEFVGDSILYSYGSDLLDTIVPSCFINGVVCPFSPTQGKDIRLILRKTKLSDEEIYQNSSGSIAAYLGVEPAEHHAHDARSDAFSIICALRKLISAKELHPSLLLD